MSMPSDPDDARNMFQRLTEGLPPGMRQAMEGYASQFAREQEIGQIDMGMQVTALHSYFVMLTTPAGPERFTESQALYYLAKLTPGL
jgi:hypothetical protein